MPHEVDLQQARDLVQGALDRINSPSGAPVTAILTDIAGRLRAAHRDLGVAIAKMQGS